MRKTFLSSSYPAKLASCSVLCNTRCGVSIRKPPARSVSVLTLAFVGAMGMFCEPAFSMNLLEAVDAALSQDAVWQSAQWEAKSVQQNRPIARGAFFPQVSVSIAQGKSTFDREFQSGGALRNDVQRVNTTNNALQLRQTLFSLDALARYRQAGVQGSVADETLRKERQDLIVRVATAYIDVLVSQDVYSLSEVDDRAAAEQANGLSSALKRGEAAASDEAEARARADIARVKLLEAGEALEANLRTLELITGQRAQKVAGFNKQFDWRDVVRQPFDEWRDLAATNNPEVRVAQKTIEFFEEEVARQQAGHAPRLDLVLSRTQAQSDSVNTVGVKSDVDSAFLQLQVPIFSGFAVNESVAQARLRLAKSQSDRDAALRRVGNDLYRSYTGVKLAHDKLSALDKAVKSAEGSVKAAQLGVKTGLRVMADVFTAQQKLYQARVDYARGFYDAVLSLLKLRAGTGALGDEELRAVASVFSVGEAGAGE